MRLLYFAWVRERVGRAEESVELPSSVQTVGDLIQWLTSRSEAYAQAFASPGVVRAAIDHRHVKSDARLAGAREVAFFPPMTGG